MSVTMDRQRIRLRADAAKASGKTIINDVTGGSVDFWRGDDVQIELGFFYGDVMVNVTNFATATLEVKDTADIDGDAVMTATITTFSNDLTDTTWDARTAQHAVVTFDNTATQLDLGGLTEKEYWVVVHVTTTSARKLVFSAGKFKCYESGRGGGIITSIASQLVNVRSCGAMGDGSTDDTAAFQKAIDTGLTLYVPGRPNNWHYVINGELHGHERLNFVGDGPYSVIRTAHATKPMLVLENADDVIVRGIRFIGSGDANMTWVKGEDGAAIKAFNCKRLSVIDCIFENFAVYGVYGQALFDAIIAGNRFHKFPAWLNDINALPSWERAAIYFAQVAEDCVIERNTIDGSVAYDGTASETGLMKTGIMLQCMQGAGGTDIDPASSRWTFQAAGYGSMRRNIIRHNRVNGMNRYGICVYKGDSITEDNFNRTLIYNNQVRNVSGFCKSGSTTPTYCTGSGIYNQSPWYSDIHDNTINNCGWRNRDGGLAGHGITVGGEYCRVHDNEVNDCPAGGVKHFFTYGGQTENNTGRNCGGIMTSVTLAADATVVPFPNAYRIVAGDTIKLKYGGTNYSGSTILTRTVASVDKVNDTLTLTEAVGQAMTNEPCWFVPNAATFSLFVRTPSGSSAGGTIKNNMLDGSVGDITAQIDLCNGIVVQGNVLKDCMGPMIISTLASPVVSGNLIERMKSVAYLSVNAGVIHLNACSDVMVFENRTRDPRTSVPGRTAIITADATTTGHIFRNKFDIGVAFVPVSAPGCAVYDNMIGGAPTDVRTASGNREGIIALADSAAPNVGGGRIFSTANAATTTTMFNNGVLGQVVAVSCTAGTKVFANGTWIKTISGSNLTLAAGQVAVFMALELYTDNRLVWHQIK